MLLYDAASRPATEVAHRIQPHLPVGYPVLGLGDLPPVGTLHVDPDRVRGTVGWVEVDGTLDTGAKGAGRALIACGGRPSVLGWLFVVPLVGQLAYLLWVRLGRPAPVERADS